MAKAAESFDVHLLKADTIYKGVPSGVVVGWAEQGRLGVNDKLRPAGTEGTWIRAGDHPFISAFLFRAGKPATAEYSHDIVEQLHAVELEVPMGGRKEEEDNDVDMIPLIDISLVLLIYFMMTAAVAALSPVAVPDMKHASEMQKQSDAITIIIDKRGVNEVFYAIRIGEKPYAAEDNNLTTQEQALQRLDVRLAEMQRPPEVRIACHKELERGWVRDLARELDKRKQKEQILYYGAEVNEKK